jgi:hypothetical protein
VLKVHKDQLDIKERQEEQDREEIKEGLDHKERQEEQDREEIKVQ